jgi:type I restriction enzyme S subunit
MTDDNHWSHCTLGDLIGIKHGWPFKSELFSEELSGKPIVVNIGNFRYSGGFRFQETTVKEYRGDYPEEYNLAPGDVLVVMTCQTPEGEILGIPGAIPDDGRCYLHNQRMGKVVVKRPDLVDLGYVYYLFLWPDFNRYLYVTASGTKILHTSPSRIEAFQFDLPPLSEQRAIARILGAFDDKIELNRRMNETLEAMAQALFKSWFVDFDPVRTMAEGRQPPGLDPATAALFPDAFEDSELGDVPRGWRVKPLDQVASFLNGLALQKYPPEDGESLPVIKIAELHRGVSDSSDRASAKLPKQYIVHDGDVLFSWSGSLEVVLWSGGPGALNQHLFRVSADVYPKWFYYHWIRHYLPEFRTIAAGKATTMGHIQRYHLSESFVAVPPASLLAKMSSTMGPLLDKQVAANLQTRTLAALRDALLPKLLSGQVRISDAERVIDR